MDEQEVPKSGDTVRIGSIEAKVMWLCCGDGDSKPPFSKNQKPKVCLRVAWGEGRDRRREFHPVAHMEIVKRYKLPVEPGA